MALFLLGVSLAAFVAAALAAMDAQYDRYTERAKKVMALAKEEVKRFNHNYIGTEHLLLGLVGEGQGIAGRVRRDRGLDLPRVREAVMFVVSRSEGPVPDDPALLPRAQRMIDLAVEEAGALGHAYVGTEHLLLALTHTDDRVLEGAVAIGIVTGTLGVGFEQVRPRVMQALSTAPGTARTRDNVVTCRVDDRTLAALNALVEVGVYTTRSGALVRTIRSGPGRIVVNGQSGRLFVASAPGGSAGPTGAIDVVDLKDGAILQTMDASFPRL